MNNRYRYNTPMMICNAILCIVGVVAAVSFVYLIAKGLL